MGAVTKRLEATQRSAVWAAYGDALGFISELVDLRGLQRRIGSPTLKESVIWQRTLGGQFGSRVNLPAGCYSDDTQLRLATCRATRGDGHFDVEAFAKVELPTWTAYALGAGRGTKVAAANLANQKATWFSNFFESKADYFAGGGNGAAMRIQPHVWVSRNPADPKTYLPDVIRNTISTHGHPRALLGSIFHAICLGQALSESSIPDPQVWAWAVEQASVAIRLIQEDAELATFWVPVWEERFNTSIEQGFKQYIAEAREDVAIATKHVLQESPSAESYNGLLKKLDAFNPQVRGSGSKTAILASALAWIFRENEPETPLIASANALGSDTDTIGTMAGAIRGVTAEGLPHSPLMDIDYISREAARLATISRGKQSDSFTYPDLTEWAPPRTQLDVVVQINNGDFMVTGLGRAKPVGPAYESRGKDEAVWQWLELEFGQKVICKHRKEIRQPQKADLVFANSAPVSHLEQMQSDLWEDQSARANEFSESFSDKISLHELTKAAINTGFDPSLIGHHILMLAERPDGIEKTIAYASIIVKARMSRKDREKKPVK